MTWFPKIADLINEKHLAAYAHAYRDFSMLNGKWWWTYTNAAFLSSRRHHFTSKLKVTSLGDPCKSSEMAIDCATDTESVSDNPTLGDNITKI